MKHLTDQIKESINEAYVGKSMRKLSPDARFYALKVLDALQLIDNRYKDWDKITMTVRRAGNRDLALIYYDGKYIDAFDPSLVPTDPEIIDELDWAHKGDL